MKLKKILAAVAATAVAVSAMAINTFALAATDYLKDGVVYINADKPEDPKWSVDAGVAQTDVYGVTFHVEFKAEEVANEETWIGGGIGANSNSTGWKQIEWGRKDKEITADLENGTITWLSTEPVFKADDAYAQFWLQTWGGTVTIKSADILGKDGAILSTDDAPAETEATEATEAAEETEATEAEEEDADAGEEEDVETEAEEEETEAETEEETTAAPETTAAAADASTTPAATGNVAVASIAAVMAVAGAAVIASRKRK